MTSLPVMDEALIARMMRNAVAQCGVPSLPPRSRAPVRFSSSNQTREEQCAPWRPWRQGRGEAGAPVLQFGPNRRVQRLLRFGYAINPQRQRSAIQYIRYGGPEFFLVNIGQCSDRPRLFCALPQQCVRARNLGVPLLERRPARRGLLLPGDLHPFPQTPSLLDAQVLVCVIHHRPEPARGPYIPESLRLDPILKRFPKRSLLVRSVSIQKTGTSFAEFGAQKAREFAGSLGDGADPQ